MSAIAIDLTARFVTLDLFRGLAACLVAAGHYIGGFPFHLAVDFFLVLSGFILSHRYLYGPRIRFADFVAARIARLYPLHLLTLIGFVVLCLIRFRELPTYQSGTTTTFVFQLLLLQNVGLTPGELSWNYPSWTISVEFWVNIAFFALVSRRTPSWFLAFIAVAGFGILMATQGTLDVAAANVLGFLSTGLLRGSCSFLLGILAYRAYAANFRCYVLLQNRATLASACALIGAVGLLVIPRPELKNLDFAAPFVFFAVVVFFARDSRRSLRWIEPLSHLGLISYSIYLLHYPIHFALRFLRELAIGTRADATWAIVVNDPIGGFLLYCGLVLAISHLTYTYFERPSGRLVRASLGKALS